MKNRIPGLIMLLFRIAGTAAGIRYGGTDLPSTIRGIVGALSGLGFWRGSTSGAPSNRAELVEYGIAKKKGLQLALEPLNGQGIAGYVPEPELWMRPKDNDDVVPGGPHPGRTYML